MATERELRAWLTNNQDRQDTPEFQTVTSALNAITAQVDEYPMPQSQPGPANGFEEAEQFWQNYEDSSFLDKVAGSTGGRLIRGAANLPAGAFQLGGMIGDAFTGRESGVPNAVADALNAWDESIDRGTTDAGIDGTRLIGEGLTGAGIARSLPIGQGIISRALLGLGEGAGFGAITPTLSDSPKTEKGLQVLGGAAIGGAVPLVSKGGSAVWQRFSPSGRRTAAGNLANEAAGDRRSEVVRLLRENNNPLGQGSAGEVATPANSAEFSALQRIARDYNPSPYFDLEDAQRAARNNAVRQVGGNADTLSQALSQRSARAGADYTSAFNSQLRPTREFTQLLDDPYVRNAMSKLDDVTSSRGVEKGSTEYYHMVKRMLDDMAAPPTAARPNALGDMERNAAESVRQRFVRALGESNPNYDIARQRFQANSPRINQMQVGQFLDDKLNQPITDSIDTGAQQSAARYASALRDAPGTIRRSTGQPRFDSLEQVLTPSQMGNVAAIADDLARAAKDSNLARKGLAKAADISNALNSTSLPNALVRPIMVINAVLRRTGSKSRDLTLVELSNLMRDPKKLAQVMDAALPDEKETIMRMFQTGLIQQAGEGAGTGVDAATNLLEELN